MADSYMGTVIECNGTLKRDIVLVLILHVDIINDVEVTDIVLGHYPLLLYFILCT